MNSIIGKPPLQFSATCTRVLGGFYFDEMTRLSLPPSCSCIVESGIFRRAPAAGQVPTTVKSRS